MLDADVDRMAVVVSSGSSRSLGCRFQKEMSLLMLGDFSTLFYPKYPISKGTLWLPFQCIHAYITHTTSAFTLQSRV